MDIIKICKTHGNLTKNDVYSQGQCKKCQYIWQLKYEEKNKERWSEYRIKLRAKKRIEEFNITQEIYDEKLKNQNYVCAICKKPETDTDKRRNKVRRLAIDHCHVSLKIRGLLCGKCNKALGLLEDSVETLQNAINYLIDSQ